MALKLKKSDKVSIVADVTEWPKGSGKQVLDIRTFVITSTSKGEFIPTGKGVQIPAEKAEKFAFLLLKLVKENI